MTWTTARCEARDFNDVQCALPAGHAGTHAIPAGAPPPPTTPPATAWTAAPASKPASTRPAWLLVFLILVVGGVWFVNRSPSASSGGARPTARATAAPTLAPWKAPAGFTVWADDPTVAFRWLEANEFDCSYSSGSCWGMEVVARFGCSSNLYVELSVTDVAGTVLGYTNDTAGVLGTGQKARLVFDSFEERAQKARITEISCY